jgi:hypothetical protein
VQRRYLSVESMALDTQPIETDPRPSSRSSRALPPDLTPPPERVARELTNEEVSKLKPV